MRKLLLLLLVVVGMLGCSEESQEKAPDNLLPERTMFLVLLDAHLGEAGLLQTPKDRDSNQALFARYMQSVYKKHNVDPKVFEASYKYYAADPKRIDPIYLMVVDSLSSMEGKEGFVPNPEQEPVQPPEQKMDENVPDSIKQLREQHEQEKKMRKENK